MIQKYNIPVVTEGGVPNPNNLSDEMQKIYALSIKTNRSNTGQLTYNSSTSGISYNTVDYPSVSSIYNKGETGIYNLLVQELNEYMLSSGDLNTYGNTGAIAITGWTSNSGEYSYKLNIPIAGVLSTHIVSVIIDKDNMNTAVQCFLSAANDSYDGGITVYAKLVPTSVINFTYIVYK
jgi:hypothetical protein